MEVNRPKLYILAKETIKELAREGITCTPEEVIWLNDAAAKVVHPTRIDELQFVDLPHICGNILLFPLSIGVKIWLKNYGKKWFSDGQEQIIIAYCMAHSRQPEIFQKLTNQFITRYKVYKWALKI